MALQACLQQVRVCGLDDELLPHGEVTHRDAACEDDAGERLGVVAWASDAPNVHGATTTRLDGITLYE